jgi:hypothetical protein
VFQDRFVKESRLQGIRGIEAANDVLESGFLEDLHRPFTVPAIDPHDAHVKIHTRVDLRTYFCFKETRAVNIDWVVHYKNQFFQLLQDKKLDIRHRSKVDAAEWLDGSIHIFFQEKKFPTNRSTPKSCRRFGWAGGLLSTSL